LLTRAQAIEHGVSDSAISRRLRSGRWIREHPGVFRIPGAPVTDRQRLLAATLWTGGVASHASGGRLLRVDELGGDGLHVLLAHITNRRCNDVVVHTTSTLPDIDGRAVDEIRCTLATRMLIDRAADLDDESFEAAFEAACRMGLTTLTLRERRAHELCGQGSAGIESRPASDHRRLAPEPRVAVGGEDGAADPSEWAS
jgi:hypothetical protein